MTLPNHRPEDLCDFNDRLRQDEAGFNHLARLLGDSTGIHLPLNPKNLSLMASRLAPLLRHQGIASYATLLTQIQTSAELKRDFICALTTNTSEFFREPAHFATLRELLPKLRAAARAENRPLRLWCAAASTGQEPYSLAMEICEILPDTTEQTLRFLATDIDRNVLLTAQAGSYDNALTRGIPATHLSRYFEAITDPSGKQAHRAAARLRQLITFAEFNLLQSPFPFTHKFDVIFCRNVFIYFKPETVHSILEKFSTAIRPGGYLFVGHSEAGLVRTSTFRHIATAVYQREGGKRE